MGEPEHEQEVESDLTIVAQAVAAHDCDIHTPQEQLPRFLMK